MPTEAAELVFDEATKVYPGRDGAAVDDLSLTVPAGEICVLVGPSGGGKTTALKLVNRLIELTSGDIRIDNRSIRDHDLTELRRSIGYVIQQVGLFPHMTVEANIGDGAAAARRVALVDQGALGRAARARRARPVLREALPRAALRRRAPARRPRARARREPVADADGRAVRRDRPDRRARGCRTSSSGCRSELRKTVVFVTHDIDEAIKLGDRIAILREGGRLAQYDTPSRSSSNPSTSSWRTSSAATGRSRRSR